MTAAEFLKKYPIGSELNGSHIESAGFSRTIVGYGELSSPILNINLADGRKLVKYS